MNLKVDVRRQFALAKVGDFIPGIAPFIGNILNHVSKKRKNGKFCLACFLTKMSSLPLNNVNSDPVSIEAMKSNIFNILEQVSSKVITCNPIF